MPQHHQNHDQQDPQNHDDCDDCKRQRAQNQKLIAIYQKLQEVDKKTTDMKSVVLIHKQKSSKNQQVLRNFDQKVDKVKNNKNQQEQSQFQQIGYNLYAKILESNKKSQAEKENDRLKSILKGIYQERQKKHEQIPKVEKQIFFPDITQSQSIQWFNQNDKTSRVQSRRAQSFHQTSMGKSFEISSTKSSFHLTKRKIFEKKDFQQLNLWLFQQKNQILQKQLYDKGNKSSNPENLNQSKKGIEKYINLAKNSNRNQRSSLNVSTRKGYSLNRNLKNSFYANQEFQKSNNGYSSRYDNSKQPENLPNPNSSNSSKIFNMRVRKGGVLPAIKNK